MDLDCKHPTPPSMGRGADRRRRGGFNSRKRSPVLVLPPCSPSVGWNGCFSLPGRIVGPCTRAFARCFVVAGESAWGAVGEGEALTSSRGRIRHAEAQTDACRPSRREPLSLRGTEVRDRLVGAYNPFQHRLCTANLFRRSRFPLSQLPACLACCMGSKDGLGRPTYKY